jgi:pimeloyl-ACP methyl ester carboxylesterase
VNAFEALEGRVLFAAGVTLTRADGAARSIVGRRETWIVIHGTDSSTDDPPIQRLATAVDAMSSRDQVLVVDWRDLASFTRDAQVRTANAEAAAAEVVGLIRDVGLPAERINLIGYSLGAFVADRVAIGLRRSGGVNRIVALDPAAPRSALNKRGHTVAEPMYLSSYSAYAIAFHGVDIHSPFLAATSADDTVRVDNVGSSDDERHAGVLDVFTTMVERNNGGNADGVSGVFSLARIKDGAMPGWRKDLIGAETNGGPGYEGVLTAASPMAPVVPALLTYVNRRGHTVHVA